MNNFTAIKLPLILEVWLYISFSSVKVCDKRGLYIYNANFCRYLLSYLSSLAELILIQICVVFTYRLSDTCIH